MGWSDERNVEFCDNNVRYSMNPFGRAGAALTEGFGQTIKVQNQDGGVGTGRQTKNLD